MPTIARLSHCVIFLYAGDHLPPHFHVRMHDGREALVGINDLTVLRGAVPLRELRGALSWAQANHAMLNAKWKELNP